MFHPTLGRWLQLDPWGMTAEESNLYRALSNGPMTQLDPAGLTPVISPIEGAKIRYPFYPDPFVDDITDIIHRLQQLAKRGAFTAPVSVDDLSLLLIANEKLLAAGMGTLVGNLFKLLFPTDEHLIVQARFIAQSYAWTKARAILASRPNKDCECVAKNAIALLASRRARDRDRGIQILQCLGLCAQRVVQEELKTAGLDPDVRDRLEKLSKPFDNVTKPSVSYDQLMWLIGHGFDERQSRHLTELIRLFYQRELSAALSPDISACLGSWREEPRSQK